MPTQANIEQNNQNHNKHCSFRVRSPSFAEDIVRKSGEAAAQECHMGQLLRLGICRLGAAWCKSRGKLFFVRMINRGLYVPLQLDKPSDSLSQGAEKCAETRSKATLMDMFGTARPLTSQLTRSLQVFLDPSSSNSQQPPQSCKVPVGMLRGPTYVQTNRLHLLI